jgi:large subunit ribosomal protein L9
VFEIITQASEKGMLYGAVTAISAGKILNDNGFTVAKDAVQIIKPIKTVGIYHVQVVLHADVTCQVTLNVASSREQAAANLADDAKTTEVAA